MRNSSSSSVLQPVKEKKKKRGKGSFRLLTARSKRVGVKARAVPPQLKEPKISAPFDAKVVGGHSLTSSDSSILSFQRNSPPNKKGGSDRTVSKRYHGQEEMVSLSIGGGLVTQFDRLPETPESDVAQHCLSVHVRAEIATSPFECACDSFSSAYRLLWIGIKTRPVIDSYRGIGDVVVFATKICNLVGAFERLVDKIRLPMEKEIFETRYDHILCRMGEIAVKLKLTMDVSSSLAMLVESDYRPALVEQIKKIKMTVGFMKSKLDKIGQGVDDIEAFERRDLLSPQMSESSASIVSNSSSSSISISSEQIIVYPDVSSHRHLVPPLHLKKYSAPPHLMRYHEDSTSFDSSE